MKVVILLFQPALPLSLPQHLAGGVGLRSAGSDVDGGGLTQGDGDALSPHIGRLGGIVQNNQNRDNNSVMVVRLNLT